MISTLTATSQNRSVLTRRSFLATLGVGAVGLVRLPRVLRAMEAPRSLAFHHLHTGERLAVEYFAAGDYEPQALHEVNHVLRDWRRNEMHPIDPDLLDLLHDLHGATGSRQPFEVICGYRSPETNAMLRRQSTGVSAHSLHMAGKAIDIRLPDVGLTTLRDTAKAMKRGGVGYYPSSNFVHVDTGRVRYW